MPWQSGSLKKYGGRLHTGDPTALLYSLAKICRYCRNMPDYPVIYSYALGFCCHYCYDRRLHPLVYYNVELLEKTDERGSHYRYHSDIECNLDIMLLRHETGRLMTDMSIKECLPPCDGIDTALARLYSLLLCDFCGIHTPRETAITLASDFRAGVALNDDSHAVKKTAATLAEQLLPLIKPNLQRGSLVGRFHNQTADMSFDYGNMLGSVWFNPFDRTQRSNLNFYELTDLAQDDTMELTALFADEVSRRGSANFYLFTRGINFKGQRFDEA